ncbi:MAG: efflux RND transporter periplasmic adaptor subunit [Candidatus Sericytochromatia bacterium]|nr:efflux RND transporter periplasmic adaptor subunit [Candidatus Sericytochromatia bacterium]
MSAFKGIRGAWRVLLVGWGVSQLWACRPSEPPDGTPVEAERPVAVRIERPVRREVAKEWVLQGHVQPTREWRAVARLGGRVVSLAPEWIRLTPGATLAVLEVPELAGQIQQAKAALATAEAGRATAEANLRQARDLGRRMQDLAEGQVMSDQARAQARTMIDVAEAQLAQARAARLQAEGALKTVQAQADESHVRLPSAGVVTQRLVEPGAAVMPGQPLAVVVEEGTPHVRVALPERAAAAVAPGAMATLEAVALPGVKIPARIEALAPVLDPGTRTRPVRIAPVGRHGLRPGMSVEARLKGKGHQGWVLPLGALVTEEGAEAVYVVRDGRAAKVPVTTGWRDARHVEIASGLVGDEGVIVQGGDFLRTGELVATGDAR